MAAEKKEPATSFPKSKINVLLMEGISQRAVDCFVKEGYTVECIHKLDEAALIKKIANVHVIGVRSKTKLTAKVLAAAKKLLAIGCFCIGTDQTDLPVAAGRGVPVFNAPFANTRSVAEKVIAELVVLARQMGDRSSECHKGVWNKQSKGCYEVRGKTLGIVGYGHVGSQVSVLAEAMGMRVLFFDIVNKMALGNAQSVASLDSLLEQSHFVSLHVPRTPDTKGMIGKAQIAKMQKGSYLINNARGTVVDVDAAAAALRSGHLAGAAFDVFPVEPAGKTNEFRTPLQGCPNTFLSPHIGGSTEEAQAGIGVEVAGKLISFVSNGITSDAVNFPQVTLRRRPNCHRILNVHRNVPGVLKAINSVLEDYNISAQICLTEGEVGYLVCEVDKDVSSEIKVKVSGVAASIKTRVVF